MRIAMQNLHLIELMVAELNGTLEVSQHPEQGVKVTVRFPLKPDEFNAEAERSYSR